jgi:hypothetical protein
MLKSILLMTVISIPTVVLGQATSQPILIQSETSDCTPSAGNCYLDMTFKGGSLYQHANWYTNFIGRNTKQGNLTITINSQLETGTVADTKASNPVTLTKNGNDVSFSYQGPIASLLPLTFSQVSFDVGINQTVKDGLNDLLTLFAKQSAVTVPLSAATLGYVSLGKSIADFLFTPQLMQSRAVGHFAFTPSTAPAPGYYAVLAGETNADWGRFVPGLKPVAGGGLTSDAGNVAGITYYIYEVKYNKHRYVDLDAALSYVKSKSWASLYLSAMTASRAGWTLDQHESIESNLRKQLDDAQTLLVADVDITGEEKLTVSQQASEKINSFYQDRYKTLVQAANAQSSGHTVMINNKPVPSDPTVLSLPHDDIAEMYDKMKTMEDSKSTTDGAPGLQMAPQ